MEREKNPVVSRELANRRKRVVAQLNELKDINVASNDVRLTARETHNRNITAIAYREEEPFIYDFFYTNRELHDLIPTMKTLYKQGAIAGDSPSVLEKNDIFVQKFKGISLMDIENMEVDPKTHELVPDDIRRINRMFRSQNLLGLGKDKTHTYALETLVYFASQQWTHPEIGVPRSLKKFHENITSYFEYYTSLLTDFKRDSQNEDTMLLMLMLGKPYLPIAVSTYIPARLNITPSSTTKLYKQRELLASDLSSKLAWKGLRKAFLRSFKQAYRNDAFPEHLEKYQHYSEEIDSAAAMKLLSYMQEATSTEQQLQNKDKAENLLEQWNKHKKGIIKELMQHPKKRLEYQISKDHPGEKITMIRNRDTFVFIMLFPNDIHLTLEINKTGKLFGVPPSLLKAYPHIEDTLMVDILSPLLKKYESKETPSNTSQIHVPLYLVPSKPETPEDLMQEEDEQATRPPKRKRFMPAVTIFESDPIPPLTPQAPKIERFVAYSEDGVKELLGPQISRQQAVVDQVLKSINDFEHGRTHGKMLMGSGPIIRIRSGKYRILMDRLGGGNYSIRKIVHREDAPY